MLSYLDGYYGGAHGLEEKRVWWIDAATGDEITRPWPAGAADAVETYYRNQESSDVDSDEPECGYRCLEEWRIDSGEPLTPVFFEPSTVCGRIAAWSWTSELMLPWVARALGEWQSATNAIAPTDIEPNPIVDCTYRPGFDGPSAVGWSAVVR